MPASAALEKEDVSLNFAKDQLKSVIERIEKLEEEKKAISDDIRDVYAEDRGQRLRRQALRTIVRPAHEIEPTEREEQDAILETYMHALGGCCRTEAPFSRRPSAEVCPQASPRPGWSVQAYRFLPTSSGGTFSGVIRTSSSCVKRSGPFAVRDPSEKITPV